MKKLMVSILVSCAFVISQEVRTVAAHDEQNQGIPQSELAGTYADTIHASFFVCRGPHGQIPCTQGASGVAIDALAVGAYTSDAEGNACATWTETETVLPLSAAPPAVFVVHQTTQIMSYDPSTGAGEGSYTNYLGGACHGSTFDSTGATTAAAGTYHFVASKNGNRIDAVVTALNNAVGAFGSFSVSATLVRE
jgi:hypothetical protein